jgi:hypothetical protein
VPSKFEQVAIGGHFAIRQMVCPSREERAHRCANLAQQWRLGRRPSLLMMKIRFELHFKNFGKPRLKRPLNRNSCSVSSIQAPMRAPGSARSHKADRTVMILHARVPSRAGRLAGHGALQACRAREP